MEGAKTATRRLRMFLRDFRLIEADVSLAEHQSLASYFSSRRHYVNLRDAEWVDAHDRAGHAVLRVSQILWALAPEGDVSLVVSTLQARPRPIEIQADGGLMLKGGLALGDHQRLSDYLESAGAFVPLHDAVLLRSGRAPREVNVTLGDIVLNQDCIQAVMETDPYAPPKD
jgi:hypothetical protein